MTPEEWIGHKAFRTVKSKKWPPGEVCFASFLRGPGGTLVFYLRGSIPSDETRTIKRRQVADRIAEDIFGVDKACHRCAYEFAYGTLVDGQFEARFSTTQKQGTENPWGNLCSQCRRDLALKAREKYAKRLKELGCYEDFLGDLADSSGD